MEKTCLTFQAEMERTAMTLQCWGDNSSGQRGDGTRTNRITPIALVAEDGSQGEDGPQ